MADAMVGPLPGAMSVPIDSPSSTAGYARSLRRNCLQWNCGSAPAGLRATVCSPPPHATRYPISSRICPSSSPALAAGCSHIERRKLRRQAMHRRMRTNLATPLHSCISLRSERRSFANVHAERTAKSWHLPRGCTTEGQQNRLGTSRSHPQCPCGEERRECQPPRGSTDAGHAGAPQSALGASQSGAPRCRRHAGGRDPCRSGPRCLWKGGGSPALVVTQPSGRDVLALGCAPAG